jgi:hypothetical protein
MSKSEESSKPAYQDTDEAMRQPSADTSRGWKIVSDKKKGKQKMPEMPIEGDEESTSMDIDEGGSATVRLPPTM